MHFLPPKGVVAAPPVIIDFWSLIEKATAEPLRGRVSEECRLRFFSMESEARTSASSFFYLYSCHLFSSFRGAPGTKGHRDCE